MLSKRVKDFLSWRTEYVWFGLRMITPPMWFMIILFVGAFGMAFIVFLLGN